MKIIKRSLQWLLYGEHQLARMLLPQSCVLCHALTKTARDLCAACEDDLPWISPQNCRQCAIEIPNSTANDIEIETSRICGNCLQTSPPFDETIACYQYTHPLDYLVTQLKFQEKLYMASLLAKLMLPKVQAHYQTKNLPECIIPMPLHAARLKERGFNQAVEIAKPIAKALKVPLAIYACQRIKATAPQSETPAKLRAKNVSQAFMIQPNWSAAAHVAVVDDVMTTGHTMSALCHSLRQSGVQTIDVWCVARTF